MGQSYCSQFCGQSNCEQNLPTEMLTNPQSDEPLPTFARLVKQHIEIHPRVKQTYILYRTPHIPDKKGVKLDLYYLFQFSAYYEGDWKKGLPHGYGRIIYDDGSIYEGCFKNGVAECHQALFIREDGSFFRGNIKHNQANGYGQLSSPKLFYKGNWINDLPNGKARQIYSSISFYEGEFVQGVKEGKGIYQWNATDYYVGNFHQNKLEGKGDLITKDYTYKGQFKDGKKNGSGSYTDHSTGFIYAGHFSANIPSGQGQLTFKDGAIFKGTFDGFENRKGILHLPTGEKIPIQVDSSEDQESASASHQTLPLST